MEGDELAVVYVRLDVVNMKTVKTELGDDVTLGPRDVALLGEKQPDNMIK